MLKTMKRYWQVWLITALNAVQETFVNRWANAMFLSGKIIRFAIMTTFLLLLKTNVTAIGGYAANQMLVFYVTYQLMDTLMQVAYRGVYEFGGMVRNGSFDGVLTKPINPLFRILVGKPDLNDALFLLPSSFISFYLLSTSGLTITTTSFLLYLSLLINSFIIGTGIHIFILSFTLLSNDVDNTIWLYRDISRLGQFPVTIYYELIRMALFFVVPVGLMITIPAQVLLQVPPTYNLALCWLVGLGFLFLSLRFWNWSVKKYSSASS